MIKGAELTLCRRYRCVLWRIWDPGSEKRLMFVGLNPSTADENEDDPTIRRCIGFAEDLGYGGIYMLNLFSYRAKSPVDLKKAQDPGDNEYNRMKLLLYHQSSTDTVACWGNHGAYLGRGARLLEDKLFVGDLKCFGLTKAGHPKHPLYLKKDTKLVSV